MEQRDDERSEILKKTHEKNNSTMVEKMEKKVSNDLSLHPPRLA
jgi:hypothetical protein